MATLTAASVGDLRTLIPDFEHSLRAANKSPRLSVFTGTLSHWTVEAAFRKFFVIS